MMRYDPALGSHFCQTLSAAVVCLDISTELTPDRICDVTDRPIDIHIGVAYRTGSQ